LPPSKRLRGFSTDNFADFRGQEHGKFRLTDQLTGWVDSIVAQQDHGGVGVFGWAINESTKIPAAHIAAVTGSELIAVWPTSVLRPDIAEFYDAQDACYAGFYAVLSNAQFESREELRFFAVEDDGLFGELKCSDQALEFLGRRASDEQQSVAQPEYSAEEGGGRAK
jgi:hypothetical protein